MGNDSNNNINIGEDIQNKNEEIDHLVEYHSPTPEESLEYISEEEFDQIDQ